MSDWIEIKSDELSVAVSPDGAELMRLRDDRGRDYLWNGDPIWWNYRAPLLFPIVGGLNGDRYRVDGAEFAMPRHGFARHSRFDLIDRDTSSACFRLQANTHLKQIYPFEFILDVAYRIEGATLHLAATLLNRDSVSLPASFGFHPAFAWPLPGARSRARHILRFDKPEPAALLALNSKGLIKSSPRPTIMKGNEIPLDDSLFEQDALIWNDLHSRHLTYSAPDAPGLAIDFPQMPFLGLWTKPGAPFLCIEPWQGLADPEGYSGDFRSKPGIVEILPSERHLFAMAIALLG